MFMWSKSAKEAYIFEVNFKHSLQMMAADGEKPTSLKKNNLYYDTDIDKISKLDGVPTIDHSIKSPKGKGMMSTSKFLLNDDESEDDRLSNITEIVNEEDESKFRNLYNKQGHYSSQQSVTSIFSKV